MTVTISRLYGNCADAQRAVTSLEAAGVPHSDLSIIANNSDNWYGAEKKVDRTEEGAATGAGIGAGLGGAAGLLAGLGVLAIPGLGPVVAAGWLASTTLGVMAGAATGTIVGALTEAAYRRRRHLFTPKVFVAAGRWSRHAYPRLSGRGSNRSWTNRQLIFANAAPLGNGPVGRPLMPPPNLTQPMT